MANPSSLLSLCFLLLIFFFFFTCARSLPREFNIECQLDSINALEPDNRVESEAGVTETWNSDHPELRCAGVTVTRRTINANGLHLPSYVPFPQLQFIVQGRGVLGIAIPGCAETYEEPQGKGKGQEQQQQDRHQKVRYLREGDIVAIPTGIPYWTYNYGNSPLVVVTLLDTTNLENQLDPIPRRFYLAGNPEEEHPETQKELHKRRSGEHEEEGNNVFSGFEPQFLAEALKANVELAKKLQCVHGHRNQIIEVKRGLSIIIPPLEREKGEEEEEHAHGRKREAEEEEEEQQPRTRERREWRRESRRKQGGGEEVVEKKETRTRERKEEGGGGGGEEEGEEVVEEKETRTREPRKEGRRRRRGQGEEEGGVEQQQQQQQRGREEEQREWREGEKELEDGSELSNAVQEDVCTLKLHENIANPSRADFFNPTAGRISTVNSLTLPLLKWLQLSAEWVNLYKNAMYAPHWNINANTVIYVTRGQGRVQVVNCQGKSVFNDVVRNGQVLVVPQNFVLAKKAGSEGLEYIAFKTKDRAIIGTLVGRTSAISAIPAEVLQNAMGLSPQEVSVLKNNRNEGVLVSPASRSHSQDAFITMA